MKVYAIHTGSIHEGGGVDCIYADKQKAIEYGEEKFKEENKHSMKIHDEDPERWAWHVSDVFGDNSNVVKCWRNLVEEIIVYEYEVL